MIHLHGRESQSWLRLCEHVRLAPPATPFPNIQDIGQRKCQPASVGTLTTHPTRRLRFDRSPWIAEPRAGWAGIVARVSERPNPLRRRVAFEDDFAGGELERWLSRNDTFPGNLGLFRPANITVRSGSGLSLAVIQESLGVRNFSAASISGRGPFMYGRFEATLQATRVSGIVTGFFLHRDSPRQEIDVEITGNRPDRLLSMSSITPALRAPSLTMATGGLRSPSRWGSTRRPLPTGLPSNGIHTKFAGSSTAN